MILLLLAAALAQAPLADAQQSRHDAMELRMSDHLHAYDDAIAKIWRPSATLLSDYRKARKCYIDFHLYKNQGCADEFAAVDHDLAKK